MSDLDQLLDTIVADVRSQTRAPGAPKAIAQARRRRKVVVSAGAVAAVAVIALGSALAAGTLLGGEGRSSLAGIPTASPEPPAEPVYPAAAIERYETLRKTLTSVPGWDITEGAVGGPFTLDPCEVLFGGGGGGVGSGLYLGLMVPPGGLPISWTEYGFGYPPAAPDAMDQIGANLRLCTADSWRTQPIGQTGAVLAFTDARVVWILNKNAHVSMLQVPTTDGPPPLAVQVEVANQMYSWLQ